MGEKDRVALMFELTEEEREIMRLLSDYHGVPMVSLLRDWIMSEGNRIVGELSVSFGEGSIKLTMTAPFLAAVLADTIEKVRLDEERARRETLEKIEAEKEKARKRFEQRQAEAV